MASSSSSMLLEEQMRFMNDKAERTALTPLREKLRPVSASSSLSLELRQREDDDIRNEHAFAVK